MPTPSTASPKLPGFSSAVGFRGGTYATPPARAFLPAGLSLLAGAAAAHFAAPIAGNGSLATTPVRAASSIVPAEGHAAVLPGTADLAVVHGGPATAAAVACALPPAQFGVPREGIAAASAAAAAADTLGNGPAAAGAVAAQPLAQLGASTGGEGGGCSFCSCHRRRRSAMNLRWRLVLVPPAP